MRKILFFISIMICVNTFAQLPEKMSYQAVVRNSNNKLIINTAVGIKVSILQSSVNGAAVYAETHNPTTNDNGLISIEVGGGTVITGTFSIIDWAAGPYFIKTEIDPAGGTSYSISGTSQLLSVPYALYALEAGNGFSGNYGDLKNIPVFFNGDWNSLTNKPALSAVAISGSYNDLINKPSLFDGNYISLTNKPALSIVAISGNYNDLINKPGLFDGNYNSLTNKPALFDSSWIAIKNKPTFAVVATSGKYTDLLDKPVINNSQWTTSGNDIYFMNEVGIGTTLPSASASLEIVSTTKGFLPPRLSVYQIKKIASPAEGLVVYNTDTKKINVFDGSDWKDMCGNNGYLRIGDTYGGGVVFYIDSTGIHGLACAPTDQSTNAIWGCYGTEIAGADSPDIGAGNQNTIDIINSCTTAGTAAKICYNLSLNGYTDWYLPSYYELQLLYTNLKDVAPAVYTPNPHWTSTETSVNTAFCLAGLTYNDVDKNVGQYVRAIRAF